MVVGSRGRGGGVKEWSRVEMVGVKEMGVHGVKGWGGGHLGVGVVKVKGWGGRGLGWGQGWGWWSWVGLGVKGWGCRAPTPTTSSHYPYNPTTLTLRPLPRDPTTLNGFYWYRKNKIGNESLIFMY